MRHPSQAPSIAAARQHILLAVPVLLMLAWCAWNEFSAWSRARADVRNDVQRAAVGQANEVAARLDALFSALQFAAVAVDRPDADPAEPDSQVAALLRGFISKRRGLFAFNIHSADGNRIVWSTRRQPGTPIFSAADFVALSSDPDNLLGPVRFAPRIGAEVIALRVRVRDAAGRTRFFVGTPEPVARLMAGAGIVTPEVRFGLRDLRQALVVPKEIPGPKSILPAAMRAHLEAPVPGYPFVITGTWSDATMPAGFWHAAVRRWALEFGMLALLGLAGAGMARLLNQRDASLAQQRRLVGFNAARAAFGFEGVSADDEPQLLQRLCDILAEQAGLRLVFIARPDASGRFVFLASAGETGYLDGLDIRSDPGLPEGQGPAGRVWRDGIPIFHATFSGSPMLEPWADRARRWGMKASAALPVRRSGVTWAVLVVVHAVDNVFDAQLQALLGDLAQDLTRGLELLDARRHLRQLQQEEAQRARRDVLTGLPNHFALEEQLGRVLARAQREGRVVAIGSLDLDDFKPINDAWGHEAGDILLQEVARRLRARLRASDLLARPGGDEFVVVFDGLEEPTAIEHLTVALTRLHEAVESPVEVGPGHMAEVGMSMGLALYPVDGDSADALLRQADAAMYQAKTQKQTRSYWWRLAGAGGERPEAEAAFDAYGVSAHALFAQWQGLFQEVAALFVAEFSSRLSRESDIGRIVASLTAAEFEALLDHQVSQFAFLFAPGTTREEVTARARHLGQVHALVGLETASLVRAVAIYRELLTAHLNRATLTARSRYRLLIKGDRRMQDDMEAQLLARDATIRAYQAVLGRPMPGHGTLWADVASAEIAVLGVLPGVRTALLLRLDSGGALVVVQAGGPCAQDVLALLQEPGAQALIDPESPRGHTLSAVAWRTLQTQTTPAYTLDERYGFWHDSVAGLGLRSALAMPVLNQEGHAVAILTLHGAYPHQFESVWAQQFAQGLRRRWEELWRRCTTPRTATVLPHALAQTYRQRLFSGGLVMHLQPVVDLRTGVLHKLEALARLRLGNGTLVSPGTFLPLLGDQEMDSVFRMGLDQALHALVTLEAQGLRVGVSLNLPPATLLDPDCINWVEQALGRHGVEPSRLSLELLETQVMDAPAQEAAIARLIALGVRLAMDDLGSGYSSLRRLSALPFNTVKIDQDLLRQIRSTPVETLSLIGTLIQIGRDFDRAVIVEGLEDAGMIEAAAVLGAGYGQGYGLARPMPLERVASWYAGFELDLDDQRLKTWLGALAFHWRYLHARDDGHGLNPLDACPLTFFLRAQGLHEGDVARWHAQVHEAAAAGGQARDAAGGPLLAWLVERVRAEAQPASD